jgi:putative photosynthetic complex assembly protein
LSEQHDEFHVPWGALVGAAVLVGLTVVMATVASLTDTGATRLTLAPVVESRALHFADLADGAVAVIDATDKSQVAVLPAGHDGFVRVVLRGLAQDRAASGLGSNEPFKLSRLQDGSSVLEDPATGRVVTLNAFGANNLQAFTQLLDQKGAQP